MSLSDNAGYIKWCGLLIGDLCFRKAGVSWFWIVFLLMGVAVGDAATKPLIAGRHCEVVDIGRYCVGNVIGLG